MLSAILLNDDYYKILLEGKTVAKGLSVLRPEYLIKYIKKLPDEMYKKWKSDNTVTAEVQWENISFKHHIFTSDDLY